MHKVCTTEMESRHFDRINHKLNAKVLICGQTKLVRTLQKVGMNMSKIFLKHIIIACVMGSRINGQIYIQVQLSVDRRR